MTSGRRPRRAAGRRKGGAGAEEPAGGSGAHGALRSMVAGPGRWAAPVRPATAALARMRPCARRSVPAPAVLPLPDRIAAGLVGLWALLVTALFATTGCLHRPAPARRHLAMLRDPARGRRFRSRPWTKPCGSRWTAVVGALGGGLPDPVRLARGGRPAGGAGGLGRAGAGRPCPPPCWAALAWSRPLFWGFAHYALSFPVAVAPRSTARCRRGAETAPGASGASGCWRWPSSWSTPDLRLHLGPWAGGWWGAGGRAAVGRPGARGSGIWLDASVRWRRVGAPWPFRAGIAGPGALEAEAPWATCRTWAPATSAADALGALTLSLQGFIKRTLVDDIAAIGLWPWASGADRRPRPAARGRDRGALAAALACGGVPPACSCLSPRPHIQGQYYLSTRMAPWIPLALAPLVALVPVPGWARWARLGATGGLAALALGGVGFAFSTFASEAAPVDRLLAQVEPEKRLMLWAGTRSSRALPSNPFTHYLSWTAAETGGTTTFSFASFRPNPVVYRDRDAAQRSIPGEEFKAWCTAVEQAQDVDYVVTRGATRPRKLCAPPATTPTSWARGGGRRVGMPGDGAPAGGKVRGYRGPSRR